LKIMPQDSSHYRIKIMRNGPYLVSGHVPLSEKLIVPSGKHEYVYQDGRVLPQAENYSLCRCGKTKNAPFCDGSHIRTNFDGTETASKAPFMERASKMKGITLDLLDDGRCALARFCHSDKGLLSHLIRTSDDPENRAAALKAITECPAGRLVALEKDGQVIEPELDPGIDILKDPEQGVCGPIFVKGYIPIESADGEVYEVRNRITLCRCGVSRTKPFCDAKHVAARFNEIFE
jgi:CDGSH-type Zn-finger protein